MAKNTYPNSDPSLMLDLTRSRLSRQLDDIDAIEAKIGIFLGWSTGLIAIYAAFLALHTHASGPIEIVLLSVNLSAYATVAIMGLRSLRLHEWVTGPQLDRLWVIYEKHDSDALRWREADNFYNYYQENQPEKDRKANYLRLIRIGLIVQTVTVLLGVGLS